NCAVELLDKAVEEGYGDKPVIFAPGLRWTYKDLHDKSNQIAHILQDDLRLVSGERVLLHSPNTPMMAAVWFGILKACGIVVATMPLLRSKELQIVIEKAEVRLAVCDHRISEPVSATKCISPENLLKMGDGDIEGRMEGKASYFEPVDTYAEDVALIAFT